MTAPSPQRLRRRLDHPIIFLRWLLLSALIGVVAGGVSTAFYYAFFAVSDLRHHHPWLIFLLPVGGLAIAALYHVCGMDKDRGTNYVLAAVRENAAIRLRTAP